MSQRSRRSAWRVRCGEIVRYLCDNLDEGLNSRRCREIRRHLKNCPNCTAYLDSLKKTVFLYKHIRNPKPEARRNLLLAALRESRARSKK